MLADSSGVEILAIQLHDGTYRFDVLPGSYQIYVRQGGYNFNPSKIVFTNINLSYSGLNITIGNENHFPMGPIQYIPAGGTAELSIETAFPVAWLREPINYGSENGHLGCRENCLRLLYREPAKILWRPEALRFRQTSHEVT